MIHCTALVRALYASVALAVGLALASCETDGSGDMTRAMRPLSPEMQAALEQKHMPKDSPILVRVFKEEAELEIWKQDETGHFALLKTYPICRWSGDLGPKVKEGDRQAPEGYYTITPGQMNPKSNYYLSFNLGFPNAYDKANDRTGAFLMVHGDCSSAGCYAMTDEQMGEIYALGREAFFGGQQAFQVEAYPFRMTPLNLAKHRNSPHMAFWRMIKEGYDHFEVSRQEPKVDVCDKHYVFDAVAPHGASTALTFNPKGRCPAYEVQEDVAAAAKEKRENDEREFANLVRSGTPIVASRTGNDGGMNPVFEAKLHPTLFDADGRVQVGGAAPGTAPTPEATTGTVPVGDASRNSTQTKAGGVYSTAAADSKPVSPPVEQGAPKQQSDNPFERMTSAVSKWVGLQKADEPPPPDPPPPSATAAAKPKPKAVQTAAQATPHTPGHPTQAAAPAAKPSQQIANNAQPEPAAPAPAVNSPSVVMEGAQPVVPSTSFDSRWSAVR